MPLFSREDASPLLRREIVWRERYIMLESHGYRLRQRYKPDWKPSWLTTNRHPALHEDYTPHNNVFTMDAVRISDGQKVFLKRVLSTSSELTIHRFLSDPGRRQDLHNHTAILLDEFTDDDDTSFTYMVLPLLRPYYIPKFFSVDEVLYFIKQLLEGMVYMHKLNVAHRDCSVLNIMMYAEAMYPKGFHPKDRLTDASGYKFAYPKRRRDAPSVRYYYIDFGISSMLVPGEPKKVFGIHGQDFEVPELSETVAYDPFFVEVFILGNLFRKSFVEKYMNLRFLEPLIEEMTDGNWMHRCTSPEALQLFNGIISQQSWYSLRWRLKGASSISSTRFFRDVGSISRESFYLTESLLNATYRTGQVLHRRLKDRAKAVHM